MKHSLVALVAFHLCGLAAAVPHGHSPSSTPATSPTTPATSSTTPATSPTTPSASPTPSPKIKCSSDITSPSVASNKRWVNANVSAAWGEIRGGWGQTQGKSGADFREFVGDAIGDPQAVAQCGKVAYTGCISSKDCNAYKSPAGYLLGVSFANIQEVHNLYYASIQDAGDAVDKQMGKFTSTFTPSTKGVSAAKQAIDILLAIFTLGSVATFNHALKGVANAGTMKDVTNAAVLSFSSNMVKDSLSGEDPVGDQNSLTSSLGDFIEQWRKVEENYLSNLFSGKGDNFDDLEKLIAYGNMLKINNDLTSTSVSGDMERMLYGQLIQDAWNRSDKLRPVIVKGENECSSSTSEGYMADHLNSEVNSRSHYCKDGWTYYLLGAVLPPVSKNEQINQLEFDGLAGIWDLNSGKWGSITVEDIIESALAGYEANGNKNGYEMADVSDVVDGMGDGPIKFPAGFFNFPVCENAKETVQNIFNRWNDDGNVDYSEYWPCDGKVGDTPATTLHVNKGYIDVNGEPMKDTIKFPMTGNEESTATIYAEFDGSNDMDQMVKPGCQLDVSWPANYGDIYWGEDNCLYDSTGTKINDQCCGSNTPGKDEVKNPYYPW